MEPRPQATRIKSVLKFGYLRFQICLRTDRQTDRQTRSSHRNALLPYRGGEKNNTDTAGNGRSFLASVIRSCIINYQQSKVTAVLLTNGAKPTNRQRQLLRVYTAHSKNKNPAERSPLIQRIRRYNENIIRENVIYEHRVAARPSRDIDAAASMVSGVECVSK